MICHNKTPIYKIEIWKLLFLSLILSSMLYVLPMTTNIKQNKQKKTKQQKKRQKKEKKICKKQETW